MPTPNIVSNFHNVSASHTQHVYTANTTNDDRFSDTQKRTKPVGCQSLRMMAALQKAANQPTRLKKMS